MHYPAICSIKGEVISFNSTNQAKSSIFLQNQILTLIYRRWWLLRDTASELHWIFSLNLLIPATNICELYLNCTGYSDEISLPSSHPNQNLGFSPYNIVSSILGGKKKSQPSCYSLYLKQSKNACKSTPLMTVLTAKKPGKEIEQQLITCSHTKDWIC